MKSSDVAKVLVSQAVELSQRSTRYNDFNFYGFISLRSSFVLLLSSKHPDYSILDSFCTASIHSFFVGPLPLAVAE